MYIINGVKKVAGSIACPVWHTQSNSKKIKHPSQDQFKDKAYV